MGYPCTTKGMQVEVNLHHRMKSEGDMRVSFLLCYDDQPFSTLFFVLLEMCTSSILVSKRSTAAAGWVL